MASGPSPSASPAPGLLVAVTGEPDAGKTRLLAELAAWHGTRHGRTEGFVAVAGERAGPGAGADAYRLQLLATGEEMAWAVRDEAISPPYRFAAAAVARLERWAGALPGGSPLVVLDEFSRFEARGEGLMPLWPAIVAARPRIVVVAVRSGLEAAIEERLGRRFDLRIDAARPDALARLQGACADYGEWTRIGLFGGAAGGIETTVGTALHVAKVPLRGLALASLQGAMMTFTGFGLSRPSRVVWVPFISAGLKALSPGGSRLRPMLAIAAQGALYGAAVQIAGWNVAGVALGGALVGAWAALQGFALQYLALGGEMVKAYDAVLLWLAARLHVSTPGLAWLVGAWALLHALVAGGVALAAWRLRAPPKRLRDLIERESRRAGAGAGDAASSPPRRTHPLRDLGRWPFWLPLLVVGGIMLTAGRPLESVAWLVLRFLAVSVVLLALVSLVRPARWAEGLRRRGFWGPALALADAIDGREGDTRRSLDRRLNRPGPEPSARPSSRSTPAAAGGGAAAAGAGAAEAGAGAAGEAAAEAGMAAAGASRAGRSVDGAARPSGGDARSWLTVYPGGAVRWRTSCPSRSQSRWPTGASRWSCAEGTSSSWPTSTPGYTPAATTAGWRRAAISGSTSWSGRTRSSRGRSPFAARRSGRHGRPAEPGSVAAARRHDGRRRPARRPEAACDGSSARF